MRFRSNKYGAVKVREDGHTFDSKAEHARYCELKLLVKANEITRLAVHPRYPLEVNGKRICIYEADFEYIEKTGIVVVEDVKGFVTPEYKIKRELFKIQFPNADFRELNLGKRAA